MELLKNVKLNNPFKVVSLSNNLPENVIKRLKELGIVRGSKVWLLKKSNIAKAGIVKVFGSLIALDYFILSNIEVEL